MKWTAIPIRNFKDMFDPRLISVTDFVPHSYQSLLDDGAILSIMTPERYQKAVDKYYSLTDIEVKRIVYQSGDLKITGLMAGPKKAGKPCPILIFNRGGNGNFGKLTVTAFVKYMSPFAHKDYIVFASNYNGNDGGEGTDEFGGQDIDSVVSLTDIAKNHPQWDGQNIFVFGASRGGLMTHILIKNGLSFNAAVTMSSPSDLIKQCDERADMAAVFAKRLPDHEANDRQAYKDRSAVFWPEKLKETPMLILHGDQDTRVHIGHTTELDRLLTEQKANHKTIIYPGDDHFLTENWPKALAEIFDWFEKHKAV